VFDKSSGPLLAGPFPGNHFWADFGGQCERLLVEDVNLLSLSAAETTVKRKKSPAPSQRSMCFLCVVVTLAADE